MGSHGKLAVKMALQVTQDAIDGLQRCDQAFLHHPRFRKAIDRWMWRLTRVIEAQIEENGLLLTGIKHRYFYMYVCEPAVSRLELSGWELY